MIFQSGYTSDLPHDCKQAYPELREILEKIEKVYIQEDVPELKKYYDKLLENDDLASFLVTIGDAISVLQYCNREKKLGNDTDDINIIHNEVSARIITLFAKLEDILKSKGGDKKWLLL